MRKDDDPECAAECNFVIRRETRALADGTAIVEDVETCTGCGRVLERRTVPPAETGVSIEPHRAADPS